MTQPNSPEFIDPQRYKAAPALATHHAPSLAMPDYVEHHEGATEIGKISAEAVVSEYEQTATDIETMAAQLVDRVKECEAMTRDAAAVGEELKRAADRFRQEAKRVFRQIENCSQFTAEVRQTCADLKEKLATPAMVERLLDRTK